MRDDDGGARGSCARRLGVALVAIVLVLAAFLRIGSFADLFSPDPTASVGLLSSIETTTGELPDDLEVEGYSPAGSDSGSDLGKPPKPRQRYPHIEVDTVGEPQRATHQFLFEGRTHEVSVDVDSELYRSAAAADRLISTPSGESEEERWAAYYRFMVQDRAQAPLIGEVAKQLGEIAKSEDLGRDRYAELIAKYVQTMPYDFSKLEADNPAARFPVQTLLDGTGVCGDKSLLLAALLAHEGYDVSLLIFDAERHMAVGIKGPGNEYPGSGYLFVESTSPVYISEVPQNFISGVNLTSSPVVVPIGTGDLPYKSADDVAQIMTVRSAARGARESLYREASQTPMTPEQAKAVNKRLKLAYDSQFKLQVIDGHEPKYLDRAAALRWIRKNAWWD